MRSVLNVDTEVHLSAGRAGSDVSDKDSSVKQTLCFSCNRLLDELCRARKRRAAEWISKIVMRAKTYGLALWGLCLPLPSPINPSAILPHYQADEPPPVADHCNLLIC